MKYFNQEKDGEEIPIYPRDKPNVKVNNENQNQQMNKTDSYPKRNLIIIIISLIIFLIILKLNSGYNSLNETVEKLDKRIELLESQIKDIAQIKKKRKIGVAVVISSLYGNGIGRFISLLTELLSKTGKYNVYLIVEQITSMDLPYYKDVIRIIQKKDEKTVPFDIDSYLEEIMP